jgi:hypothetical protein
MDDPAICREILLQGQPALFDRNVREELVERHSQQWIRLVGWRRFDWAYGHCLRFVAKLRRRIQRRRGIKQRFFAVDVGDGREIVVPKSLLNVVTRTAVLGYGLATALSFCACSRKSDPSRATQGPAAVASSSVAAAAPKHTTLSCKERGTSFSFGPIESHAREDNEADGDGGVEVPEDLPFGVTIGSAFADAQRFVISAIDARPDGSHSALVVLDSEVSKGTVVDLGRVYGDPEPPQAVFSGDDAFVIVPDSDAGGNRYRYGWVRGINAGARPQWSGSLEIVADDSAVMALAQSEGRIVAAWDEVERRTHVSQVRWAVLVGGDAKPELVKPNGKSPLRVETTALDVDAEMPRLVAQRSGFWLAYLAGDARPKSNPRSTLTSDKSSDNSNANEDVRPVELGRRAIVLLALDAQGKAKGKPIPVTDASAHVMTFELEASTDGGALIAYRDSDVAPGTEERVIEVVRVRPDGGVERRHIDDERIGVGVPLLLVDAQKSQNNDSASAWLAISGSAGETRLADLSEPGAPAIGLVEAKELFGVEPLVRFGQAVLVARRRARSVQFERFDCRLAKQGESK